MITRLAPTPSGYLHTGNIFNFLLNWLWAKNNGGKVMLRIDDGDAERKRKEYVEDIFRVLDWLGMDWDIGPTGPDDFENNWSQLNRIEWYDAILNELQKKNMLFACTCSRKQECYCADKNISLLHSGTAWKMRVPHNSTVVFQDKYLGEAGILIAPFVARKKDGFAAYQICSLADDSHFGTTHICRGSDLKESTAMQLFIDSYLQPSCFGKSIFWHHPLINNNSGTKLSKTAGTGGQSIIKSTTREKLFTSFAAWMGWHQTDNISLQQMMQQQVFANSR